VGRSVPALGRAGGIGLLDLFLYLVASSGTAGCADGATDDRAGRSGDRATDQGAGRGATERTRARSSLIVAFGSFTGDRAADSADRAANDCTGGATDGHTDGRAAEKAGTGAHGLRPALLILRSRTTALVHEVVMGMVVRGRCRVVVHWGPPCVRMTGGLAGDGTSSTPLTRR